MTSRRGVVGQLYEAVTGRPWLTVRSAAAEFGPPPGAVYEGALSAFSDAELYAHGEEILAAAKRYHEQRMQWRTEQAGGSDRVAAGPNPAESSSHSGRGGSVSSSRLRIKAEAYLHRL